MLNRADMSKFKRPMQMSSTFDIESQLQKLVFGYEQTVANSGMMSAQRALCMPTQIRQRGCEPLFTSMPLSKPIPTRPLPCVQNGSCPYSYFRCSRGHRWKATPGSPVCFNCPVCAVPKKIDRKKFQPSRLIPGSNRMKREIKEKTIIGLLSKHALDMGGLCISKELNSSTDFWKCKCSFKCAKGHEWEAAVKNVLLNKNWCQRCYFENRTMYESDLMKTAAHFNGQFLGTIESTNSPNQESSSNYRSSMKCRWRCEEGHIFEQYPQNIRRKPGSKRKCSWCPTCRKRGIIFEWNPVP